VRHADGRQVEHGSEVEGDTGTPRMVAPGGVDEEDIWRTSEAASGQLQQRPLAKREQAWRVWRPGTACHDGARARSDSGSPGWVAGLARPGSAAGKAHEHRPDPRTRSGPPRLRPSCAQLLLQRYELALNRRPHRPDHALRAGKG